MYLRKTQNVFPTLLRGTMCTCSKQNLGSISGKEKRDATYPGGLIAGILEILLTTIQIQIKVETRMWRLYLDIINFQRAHVKTYYVNT